MSNESQCLHFTYVNILAHSDTILKHTKNSCETEGQTTLQKQASSKTSNYVASFATSYYTSCLPFTFSEAILNMSLMLNNVL